jgi:hypothetical protein
MAFSGWRAAVWLIAALLVASLLLTALFWIGIVVAALAVVGSFNLLVIPRLAARLHAPEAVLAIGALPLLAGVGLMLGGPGGLLVGGGVWALGVAVPRFALRRYRHRLGKLMNTPGAQGRPVRVIDTEFRYL